MRRRWIALIGLGCALLTGCAADDREPATPGQAQAMQSLRLGQKLVGCGEPCLAAWRSAQPTAQRLVAAGQWRDVAVLLAGIGYADDLTLYYLGEAAQGLGFYPAAAGYFRQSGELSAGPAACARLSRLCGGIALPQAARARLAALERPPSQPRAPEAPGAGRTGPAAIPPARGAAPLAPDAAAPEGAAPGTTVPPMPAPEAEMAPLPPAAPALLPPAQPTGTPPAPAPRGAAALKPGEDYIEPPPAGR